ncbi:MAG TPA: hypothetical protein G4O02_13670 [Caldilineae bacterium]|nr:hypothetical protein [Caldilineae bacterium]
MAKRGRRSKGTRWQQWLFWGISLLVVLSMILAYVLVGSPPPPPPTPTPTPMIVTP